VGAIKDLAPEGGFTIAPPADDDFFPWPGIFTGALWLGFYVWISNHMVVQKVLSAKNIDHGRWGALFAGLMQLPFLVLLIFPGILARGVFDDLPDDDMVWPALVFEILPYGLRGSRRRGPPRRDHLDARLGAERGVEPHRQRLHQDPDRLGERKLLVVSRILVGVFMVIAALWAPVILTFEGIVEYFQSALGYMTMPLVVVLLGGIFWKRATPTAAFVTFAGMGVTGLLAFFAIEIFELFEIQFLYGTGIMVAASFLVFVGISLVTQARDPEEVEEVMFNRGKWEAESEQLEGKPFYKNYRWISLGALILTIAVVVPFI
jgi:solute:Na+ symporter, SSS family